MRRATEALQRTQEQINPSGTSSKGHGEEGDEIMMQYTRPKQRQQHEESHAPAPLPDPFLTGCHWPGFYLLVLLFFHGASWVIKARSCCFSTLFQCLLSDRDREDARVKTSDSVIDRAILFLPRASTHKLTAFLVRPLPPLIASSSANMVLQARR